MALRLVRLEDRLLFDAAATAVIADVANKSGSTGSTDTSHVTSTDHAATAAPAAVDSHAPTGDAATPITPSQVNVLVISSEVSNAAQLAAAAASNVIVVQYDAQTASLQSIASSISNALQGEKADTIAFATHGNSGVFLLTSTIAVTNYTLENTPALQQFWHEVGSLLNNGGEVNLIACDVASNDQGLVSDLDSVLNQTGQNIQVDAATNNIGTSPGENWVLSVGDVDASSYFNAQALAQWTGSLTVLSVTNTNASGAGSLAAAVTTANANPGDVIDFSLNVGSAQTITLTSTLSITAAVTIDGTTATSYSFGSNMVSIHGPSSGAIFDVEASNVTIKGLNLVSSSTAGIEIGASSTPSNDTIQQNVIGITLSNTASSTGTGVLVMGGTGITIGGTGLGNILSGNSSAGINLEGGSNISIINNDIGTNASSSTTIGNGIGVSISGSADSITIGGTTSAATNNFISYNTGDGIDIFSSTATNISINNNQIGTNTSGGDGGTSGASSAANGIAVTSGVVTITNDVIGDQAGDGIHVSGGTVTIQSNHIGTTGTGGAIGNHGSGITLTGGTTDIGGTAGATDLNNVNRIWYNLNNGIYVDGATGTVIEGNFIGVAGGGSRPNDLDGIRIDNGSTNTIITANVISSNDGYGIDFQGTVGGTGTIVESNIVGLDTGGTVASPNSSGGILVASSGGSVTIGGTSSNANTISGNDNDGIQITGSTTVTIGSNYVGTNSSSSTSIGNTNGIVISGSAGTVTIGGTTSANYISYNTGDGINVTSSTASVSIADNGIGTNVTGGNGGESGTSSTSEGIAISNGTVSIQNNAIVEQHGDGINVSGGTVTVQANHIGTSNTGGNLGNVGNGILLTGGTTTIGGTAGATDFSNANRIWYNGGDGVYVDGANGTVIEGNYIGVQGTSAVGNGGSGVEVTNSSASTTITNNIISGNDHYGINFDGTIGTGTVVELNTIGLDTGGTLAVPNTSGGIQIASSGGSVTIGGTNPTLANTITGNTSADGILVDGSSTVTITANFIGTNSSSSTSIGNTNGIVVSGLAGTVTIGGASSSLANLISYNKGDGIMVSGSSANVTIEANGIGTNASGVSGGTSGTSSSSEGIAVSNGTVMIIDNGIGKQDGDGISVSGGTVTIQNNNIGTSSAGYTNLGNTGNGIIVTGGTVTIGGTAGATDYSNENSIWYNGLSGVDINGATGTVIEGNYIGVSSSGTNEGNTENGIFVNGSTSTLITTNVISGNGNVGISFIGAIGSGIVVESNIIGLNPAGNSVVANTGGGILILSTGNSITIGGTAGAIDYTNANTIAGNGFAGIDQTSGSTTLLINYNYIGTNSTSASGLSNTFGGISIGIAVADTISNNIISGTTTGSVYGISKGASVAGSQTYGNTIEHNAIGIQLSGSTTSETIGGTANTIINNTTGIKVTSGLWNIQNNYIGTNSTSTTGLGNGTGIELTSTTAGTVSVAGNVISGNTTVGILVDTSTATDSISITGNDIGTNVSGSAALANGTGIELFSSSSSITVQANEISGNTGDGITVSSGSNNIINGSNYIGTNSLGGTTIGNGAVGLYLSGGTTTISANTFGYNYNNIQVTSSAVVSSISGNTISNALHDGISLNVLNNSYSITSNTISNNGDHGILLSSGNIGSGVLTIGGTSLSNTISSNALGGIYMQNTNAGADLIYGNTITFNGASNSAGGITIVSGTVARTIENNTLYGNIGPGIDLDDGANDTVQGNTIGLNGNTPSANSTGILIAGSGNYVIGGSSAGQGNIISGNVTGLSITGSGGSTTIYGNTIGLTAANGTIAANTTGVLINTSTTFTIGGTQTGQGNYISGNTTGLELEAGTDNVYNNVIGLNSSNTAEGNGIGIWINGGSNHNIGGSSTGQANTISGNTSEGIYAFSGTANVYNNVIGLSTTGGTGVGNAVGVLLNNAAGFTLGGTGTNQGNIISGNTVDGVSITGGTGYVIEGNYIGTNSSSSTTIGNANGIVITGSLTGTVMIGGTANYISYNTGDGIMVSAANAIVTIQNNGIGTNATGGNGGTSGTSSTSDGVAVSNGIVSIINNAIVEQKGDGINVSGGTVTIQSNHIGTSDTGGNLGNTGNGITLTGGSTTIGGTAGATDFSKANRIWYNGGDGVYVDGANGTAIEGNYIGIQGVSVAGNLTDGVRVDNGSTNTTISTNVISANNGYGINFEGTVGGTGTVVESNIIGLDIGGTAAVPNGSGGILIASSGGSVTIGGTTTAFANTISGNTASNGIIITGNTTVTISDNYIGTNSSSSTIIGNTNGIAVGSGAGTITIVGNFISYNTGDEIFVSSSSATVSINNNQIGTNTSGENGGISGTSSAANGIEVASGVVTITNDVIGDQVGDGIHVSGGTVTIQSNHIGTTGDGNPIGNHESGITLTGGTTDIGGTAGATDLSNVNRIWFNVNNGIYVDGATGTVIEGNFIGIAGGGSRSNGLDGIRIDNGSTNTIITANVISSNDGYGINFQGTVGGTGTVIESNIIGLDTGGTVASANTSGGILVASTGGSVTIGGTFSNANTIAGNTSADGILISGSTTVTITSNYIGTNVSSSTSIGNKNGVVVSGSAGTVTIGGTTASLANAISYNSGDGIIVSGASATVSIQNNGIGTNVSGGNGGTSGSSSTSEGIAVSNGTVSIVSYNVIGEQAGDGINVSGGTVTIQMNDIGVTNAGGTLANAGSGIIVTGGTTDIGGTAGEADQNNRNIIAFNTGNGVYVDGATGTVIDGNYIGFLGAGTAGKNLLDGVLVNNSSTSTTISSNVISGNGGYGIDFQGSIGTGTVIRLNSIGLTPSNNIAIANGSGGILVASTGNSIMIGGTAGDANTIGGNTGNGITVTGSSSVSVSSNYIGTNATGNVAIGNSAIGLSLSAGTTTISGNTFGYNYNNIQITSTAVVSSISGNNTISNALHDGISLNALNNSYSITSNTISNNGDHGIFLSNGTVGGSIGPGVLTIGGTGVGNTISSNALGGIYMQNNDSGDFIYNNTITFNGASNSAGGITITAGNNGHTIVGNTLYGNTGEGIDLAGGTGHIVQGNIIGLNGSNASSNGIGILIGGTGSYTIGGSSAGQGNTISGNTTGISVGVGTAGISIAGNYIGTNSSSSTTIGNTNGILISGTADSVTVGGASAAYSNYISYNTGIEINMSSSGTQNLIFNNFIGTNTSGGNGGTSGTSSGAYGIEVSAGTVSILNNVIGDQSAVGIHVDGGTTIIQQNYIGVNSSGANIGNAGSGIRLVGGTAAIIGGTSGAIDYSNANTIGFNTGDGVFVDGVASTLVNFNYIGVTAGGTNVGNTMNGVQVDNNSANTTISNNVISGNQGVGIDFTANIGAGTVVKRNLIGVNPADTSTVANFAGGIQVASTGNSIIIGGTSGAINNADANTISGNGIAAGGINHTSGSTTTLLINYNYIGTTAGGAGFANFGTEISTSSSAVDTISNNIIDGSVLNNTVGIQKSVSVAGSLTYGNTILNNAVGIKLAGTSTVETIGGTANTITSNTTGIQVTSGLWNIQGNYIGTNSASVTGLGNGTGIELTSTTVGTITVGVSSGLANQGNIISGNTTGILIDTVTAGNSVSIYGNYIGTNVAGTAALGNSTGIQANSSVATITIGGVTANQANVISGNINAGVLLSTGSATVVANLIGLNAAGTAAIANAIGISITGGSNHIIGGSGAGLGNIISGNSTDGVSVTGGTANMYHNVIGLTSAAGTAVGNSVGVLINSATTFTLGGTLTNQGNYISGNSAGVVLASGTHNIYGNIIGLNSNGTARGNNIGISIIGGSNHNVGGSASGQGNVISGNTTDGISVTGGTANVYNNVIGLTSNTGTAVANGVGVLINSSTTFTLGGTLTNQGNYISGNTTGIVLQNGTQNVYGNIIGLDASNNAKGNGIGISITGGNSHNIGGALAGQRNYISGNTTGISVAGTQAGTANVYNNVIGLTTTGATGVGNTTGVLLNTSVLTFILGGPSPNQGNIISGNTTGIELRSGTQVVVGNTIGLNIAGNATAANTVGILISGGTNHLIGGSSATQAFRNIISGNTTGISVTNGSANIWGNYIGLDKNGNTGLGNATGINLGGTAGFSFTLGSTSSNERNIISGNTVVGINLSNGSDTVMGQYIGTDPTGTLARPNPTGILVSGGSNHVIGGTGASIGASGSNLIAGNTNDGIDVTAGSGTTVNGNFIGNLGSSALANGGSGISVSGTATSTTISYNVLSGNTLDGARINAAGVTISNNDIGTNQTASSALANGEYGINSIGGSSTVTSNTISGNSQVGVLMSGGTMTLQSNYIGTNASSASIGNGGTGVTVSGTSAIQLHSNTIADNAGDGVNFVTGALTSGTVSNNTIASNASAGLSISTTGAAVTVSSNSVYSNAGIGIVVVSGATGATIQSNLVGTLGSNAGGGVELQTSGNTVNNNTISGNALFGLHLTASSGAQTAIMGNTIELNPVGILVDSTDTSDSVIGDPTNVNPNVISSNTNQGILLNAGTWKVQGNALSLNGTGIDIEGGTGDLVSSNTITSSVNNGILINTGTQTIQGNTLSQNGTGITLQSGTGDLISGNTITLSVNDGIDVENGGHTIQGNYIGTDVAGDTGLGNGNDGILLNTTTPTLIGGSGAGQGNVIGSNGNSGIEIFNGSGNTFYGNFIGIGPSNQAIGNASDGIYVGGGTGHIIGGTGAGERNVISNNDVGIYVDIGSQIIKGNYIGTTVSGNGVAGNNTGIDMSTGAVNTIGGTNAGNVIGGNGVGISIESAHHNIYGNSIGIGADGSSDVANTIGIELAGNGSNIGGTGVGQGNTISWNGVGIQVNAGSQNIHNNYIGLNTAGTAAAGGGVGILINTTTVNTIGGTGTNQGNFIGGNTTGIEIDTGVGQKIYGNYIGTAANGSTDAANVTGIWIKGGSGDIIGGIGAGERNVISGNSSVGLQIDVPVAPVENNFFGLNAAGTAAVDTTDTNTAIVINTTSPVTIESNFISGNYIGVALSTGSDTLSNNYIGTDVTGLVAVGNRDAGILLSGGSNHTIEDNIISGNTGAGILVTGGTANVVENSIGLKSDGTTGAGNTVGVEIASTTPFTLGVVGEPNIISGNTTGVEIVSGSGDTVVGNYIGLDSTGTVARANTTGVLIAGGSGNTIGGASATYAFRNLISDNVDGVVITGGSANIYGNYIQNNTDGFKFTAASNYTLDSSATGTANLISGNTNGVEFAAGSSGNTVQNTVISGNTNGILVSGGSNDTITTTLSGNTTGLLVTGGTANVVNSTLTNNQTGVVLDSTTPFTLGAVGSGNQITNNSVAGVLAMTGSHTVIGNTISGNTDGVVHAGGSTTVTQNTITNNTHDGVSLTGGTGQIINNTISNNTQNGIGITGGSGTVRSNTITGSSDGIDVNAPGVQTVQSNVISSNTNGVELAGASSAVALQGNTIFGNVNGVYVHSTVTNGTIQGNTIGLDLTGTINGNSNAGVLVESNGVTIGGNGSQLGNVISGNTIGIELNNADTAMILGNKIGTDSSGTQARGNLTSGILIIGTSDNNVIGSSAASGWNYIAFNGSSGITVDGANATGNTFYANNIWSNGNTGIFLENNGNGDEQPPTILSANFDFHITVNALLVSGIINGPAGEQYVVQIYGDANAANPEGKVYFGSATVTSGSTPFLISIPNASPAGINTITATETEVSTGNTSSFSSQPPVVTPPEVTATPQYAPNTPPTPVDISGDLGFGSNFGFITDNFSSQENYYSQLLNNGRNLGFDALLENGDRSMSFAILRNEPVLLNHHPAVGFGSTVNALQQIYMKNAEVQEAIKDLSGQTPHTPSATPSSTVLSRISSWFHTK